MCRSWGVGEWVIFCIPNIFPGGAEAELLRSHLVDHSSRIPASPLWGKRLPLTQVQFLGWEDPLEKGMAIHSSILAWRIPRAEEPGGLQSMGLQSWTQLSDFTSLLHFIRRNLNHFIVCHLTSSVFNKYLENK